MPFSNEKANKLAHNRILSNPKIRESLEKYQVTFDPSTAIDNILANLISIDGENHNLASIFSVDGGFDKVPVDNKFPSAEIGFIQFSLNLVKLNSQAEITKNGLVNPIEFNRITEAHTHSLDLPIFNTLIEGFDNTRDSIRYKINNYFVNSRTFSKESYNLLDTLYEILSEEDVFRNFNCVKSKCKDDYYIGTRRLLDTGEVTEEEARLKLLGKQNFNNDLRSCNCPNCGARLYLIDYLRLHELVDEDFGAGGILSRLCRVVEQLYPLNLIMGILKNPLMQDEYKYKSLSRIGFIIDGPLAIYGEPAKLNRSIHRYLGSINDNLIARKLNPITYFGLTKSGAVVDHVNLLLNHIKGNSIEGDTNEGKLPRHQLLIIDDEYRFRYIHPKLSTGTFGSETYYGQDMVYFNRYSQPYVINVLYPVGRTSGRFREQIFNHNAYPNLKRIVTLIEELEVDIYDNALLPIVLAHKYASISLRPGVGSLEEFARSIIE
ncbi:TPA: DNA double-strand break repair nuclease NurA [Bacillus thuringiensis]|nr:DNA double-strand break repair nuclease NurA [Bacillus thuringiensis]HDR8186660.1 DNA double-strand break repair nuclease NurA [Bacillus thuringiensis]